MNDNPLFKLETLGQSIWLDFIRRALLTSGELKRFIEEDGISGVTSNPSIFEKAIAGSHDYDQAIQSLAAKNKKPAEIYESLMVEDLQKAADIFRPVYDRTGGRDGFVSIEVSPRLAHDTKVTLTEARRLWSEVNRPNVMIKVPGTREGLPAIRQLTREGINVNVTLLFGLPRYRDVAAAYKAGLEDRVARGEPIDHVASVASFFLSRIDVLVDPILEKSMLGGGLAGEVAESLHGQAAIASAKIAYQIYKEIIAEDQFKSLEEKGGHPQKLLWASTSTKNPNYSDVKYVEALIGADTVNTLPMETIHAYRDHGKPALRLESDIEDARRVLQRLSSVNIDLDKVTQQLEDEGVDKFVAAYDQLMDTIAKQSRETQQTKVDRQKNELGKLSTPVEERVHQLAQEDFPARFWRNDPALWKNEPTQQESIRNGLGWMNVVGKMEENLEQIHAFVQEVQKAGFRHVLHMGMGGSSLAPLAFERIFKPVQGGLPLTVLDTTDPATIQKIEGELPLERTLFIVASKSGTTAEPLAFGEYFYDKVRRIKGNLAGDNFIAITDPDTALVGMAKERHYRRVFLNFNDIGGRYSALSYFGLLPAALMGLDLNEFLSRTLRMVHACASSVPVNEDPGLKLGAILGEMATRSRDKVTFLMPPSMDTLGMWLEQLIAESTGKEGRGILPVAGEPVGDPDVYGNDRLFAYFTLKSNPDSALDNAVNKLIQAGQPVVAIHMDDLMDIGQEFYRWEVATAVAGSILGINAFNQPNVQESKDNTNQLLAKARANNGRLPEDKAVAVSQPLSVYASTPAASVRESLSALLANIHQGDYVALMAYLPEDRHTQSALQQMRLHLRDKLSVATTLGYGPRFLHSTGQYHKGGPNTGVFLQMTADNVQDAPIPGESYTFGTLKRAQAQGDLQALYRHGRRAIRIHLGSDVTLGLSALAETLDNVLNGL